MLLEVSLIIYLNICIIKWVFPLYKLAGGLLEQKRWGLSVVLKAHKQLQCKSQYQEPIKIKAMMFSATDFIT